jgi:hypothetical protein
LKKPSGRHANRRKDNICKQNITLWTGFMGSEYGPRASHYEWGNKECGSLKEETFLIS